MILSGTYMFPLYGIHYFATHPSLWAFYVTVIIPQLVFIFLIYTLTYVLLYPIQAFFAVIFSGPAGLITVWFTVLQQAGFISTFLCATLLMPEIQKVAFDAVLSRECQDDVVLLGKLRRIVKVPFLIKFGHTVLAVPSMIILPFIIFRGFIFILIGSIPILGPFIVSIIQAPTKGLQSHSRYFVLKGFDDRQIKALYRENTGQYMGFGLVANILESIPFLNIFFMFTNTIGAALWAVSIEKNLKKKSGKIILNQE
ncbi:hypothetical protein CAAN3_01S02278 [[Candida] anglica]